MFSKTSNKRIEFTAFNTYKVITGIYTCSQLELKWHFIDEKCKFSTVVKNNKVLLLIDHKSSTLFFLCLRVQFSHCRGDLRELKNAAVDGSPHFSRPSSILGLRLGLGVRAVRGQCRAS